jgi:CheY-like chemotaxis protein
MLALARQCAQALERARLFEAERQARAEAERANRSKDEFLAILSHELRTPLTPVMLTVSMLEANPLLPATLRADVASIRRNVELESRLISDLLDLTRITKGKLQLNEQDADLHLAIRAAIDICQREASARLAVDLSAPRHTVHGDSTRLQQIFWNLINNAQKFTPSLGVITVRSNVTPDGNRIRVEVADNGAGVDADLLPKLFDAFEQGDVRLAKQQAGLGLGLAISKRLVEAHRGTITAHSPGRGCGSTFIVELPLVVEALAQAASPTPHAVRLKTQLNILLVEDHAPSLRALARLLIQMGHRVMTATTVASALATAGLSKFDLLISDLGLPDGSGLDVMRRLRETFKDRAIALTGYGMESDVAASRDAGFVEHLIKPVDVEQLNDAIARVVQA